MIDLSFIILAGFLGVMKFATLEGVVDAGLPKDRGVTRCGEEVEAIQFLLFVADPGELRNAFPGDREYVGRRIRIECGQNRFYYAPDAVADRKDPIPALRTYLEESGQMHPKIPISIDPRKGVIHHDVMILLDVVHQMKYEKISFMGARGD